MKLLIDTHALIRYVDQHHLVSPLAYAAIADPANEILLSAGTIWEISIKSGLGKLRLSQPFRLWIDKAIADLGVTPLPITIDHADTQTRLPLHPRDPFDRLLATQALVEHVSLVRGDVKLDPYGITRLW